MQARCPGTLPSLQIQAPRTAPTTKASTISLVFTPAADFIYASANRGGASKTPVAYPTGKAQSKKTISKWTLSFTVPNGAQIVSASTASKSGPSPNVVGTTVTWEDVPLREGGTAKQTSVIVKVQVNFGSANPATVQAYATSNEGGYSVYALPCPTLQVSRSGT